MGESLDLEDKIVGLTASFAEKNNIDYSIFGYAVEKERLLKIEVGKYDAGSGIMRDSFEHTVRLKNKGMSCQGTARIMPGDEIREIYAKFIGYMNSNGIGLTNDFKDL